MKKPKEIHNFYKSDAWREARQLKIINENGLCERCKSVGSEVHHKKHLTKYNYTNYEIALDQDNLELLCKGCHNKEHSRFAKLDAQVFDDEGNLIL